MNNVFSFIVIIAFVNVAFSFNSGRSAVTRRALQQQQLSSRAGRGLLKSSLYAGSEGDKETPLALFQEELSEFASGIKNLKWSTDDDEPTKTPANAPAKTPANSPAKAPAIAPKVEEKVEEPVAVAKPVEPVAKAESVEEPVAKAVEDKVAEPMEPEAIGEARVAPAPRKPAPAPVAQAKEAVLSTPPPVFESTAPGVLKASEDAKTIQKIRDIPIEPAKASLYEAKEEEKTAVMKATQAVTKSFLSSSPFNEKMLSDMKSEPVIARSAKEEEAEARDVAKAQEAIKSLLGKSSTDGATAAPTKAAPAEEKGGFFDFLKSDPNIVVSQQPKVGAVPVVKPVEKVEVKAAPVRAAPVEEKKGGGFFDFLKSDPNLIPTPSAPPTVGKIFLEQQRKQDQPSVEPVRTPEYFAAKKEAAAKPAFVAKKVDAKAPVAASAKAAPAEEKKKGGFFDFLAPIDNEPVPVKKVEVKAAPVRAAPVRAAPVRAAPVRAAPGEEKKGGGFFDFLKSDSAPAPKPVAASKPVAAPKPVAPKRTVDVSAFLTKTPAPKEYVRDPSISLRSAPAELRPVAQVKVTAPPPQAAKAVFTKTISVEPKVGRSVIYNNIPEKEAPKPRPAAVAKPVAAFSLFAKPVVKPAAVAKPVAKPADVAKPVAAFSLFAKPAAKEEPPRKPSSIYKSLN